MPSETKLHHPTSALLVGEGTGCLAAALQAAQDAGWRFNRTADIYAATAWLLAPARNIPDVVLVLIESLRSDELGFFDLMSHRWRGLPAAAVYTTSAQDRRVEACRRRGVAVLSAAALVEWLAGRRSASVPRAEVNPPQHTAGVDVELDLPDGLVEPAGLLETQADPGEAQAELDETQARLAEQAECGASDSQEEDDSTAGLPLTPWSSQPRPRRRRAWRAPPAPAPAVHPEMPPPQAPAPPPPRSEPASPPQPALPPTPSPQPATRSSPTRDWEHGLLTPDELRALLEDSDEPAGPQEDQP